MMDDNRIIGMLLSGAGPRLAVAAVIAALLWAGFVWATGLSWAALR